MTIMVRDNNTNTVITKGNTHNWADMFINFIDKYRRTYTNATIEVYYGNTSNKPSMTYKTFH